MLYNKYRAETGVGDIYIIILLHFILVYTIMIEICQGKQTPYDLVPSLQLSRAIGHSDV